MQTFLKGFAVLLLGFALALTTGCGNKNAPVEPVPIETTPTGEAPPPGQEPTLPEEGP